MSSSLPTGKPYSRLDDFPLDESSIFETLADAENYAENSPIAYHTQIIGVTGEDKVYMIAEDRSLIPLTGGEGEGGTTDEAITLLGTTLGGLEDGATIPEGTTFTDFVKMVSQKRIAPTYKAPSLSLSGTGTKTVEAGTNIEPTLTAVFTQNDGGAITEYKVQKNGEDVFTDNVLGPYTPTAAVIGEENWSYRATATYAAGAVKNDNMGDPSPDGAIGAGWLAAGEAFSISENPALYALYGTGTTPNYPVIDGKIPIILGRYVDNVRIPAEGFVEAAGISQLKQEQLIVASNTIVAQMKYEDEERKKILATIGPPALASDDLPTLHARLKHCLTRFSEQLANKGVYESSSSSLKTLIDRIEEIESSASSLRIDSFTATEPLMLEKHADQVLSRLSLSWSYNDESELKYQYLSGSGTVSLEETVRDVILTPNVKDGEFEFALTAIGRADKEVKRSIFVRYVCPVYRGVSQTYDIQPEEVVLGTKVLVPEGSFQADYKSVVGYMFLAVPESWVPFVSAKDSHGFDFLKDSLRVLHRMITTPDGTEIPYRVYISRRYNMLDAYNFHFSQ